ncbi:MAG: adenylosuccinate synthase [Gemmatimonadota bacterium]
MFEEHVRCVAVVGAQWGDEGKGKLIDVLSEQAAIVARYQGGANAGHTVQVAGEEFILHLVPSGILYPETRCLLGNGCVIDPWTLRDEMAALRERGVHVEGRIGLSSRAHLVLPHHVLLDRAQETSRGRDRIGTTGRGIGPAYRDKVARIGLRVGDLRDMRRAEEVVRVAAETARPILEDLGLTDRANPEETLGRLEQVRDELLSLATDTGHEVRSALAAGRNVLLEGAQGSLLDIDHGTYPFVTSSSTTAGGAAAGVGIGPTLIDQVLGVVKAYTTRVGNGPLPTELREAEARRLRELGGEFGATTGRPRRPGWFDGVVVRYAAGINGLTALAITKLDVLDSFEEIQLATGYSLDGRTLPPSRFPESAGALERVEPVYETLPGWGSPIGECRSWEDLPAAARAYLKRLEAVTGVAVRYVSVGAARREVVRIPVGGVASLPDCP